MHIEEKIYCLSSSSMYNDIRYNIAKIYLIQSLRWFMLIISVLVLFFQENGLTMQEVFWIQTVFSVVIVLSEIPSGYCSDVFGRRNTMILGVLCGAAGFSFYCVSHGFWTFLIAEVVLGLGASFISGTDSALLYDTLLHIGEEHRYVQTEGRLLSIGNFAEGTASILGGLLAAISLRTPLYVEAALALLAVPIAFSLIEPERQKADTSRGSMRGIADIVVFALHGHREVKWLILYSAIVGASTLTMVWFIQPYLQLAGLPIALFGVVWAALQFAVGFFSLSAHRIEKLVGKQLLVSLLVLLSVAGYILLGTFISLWAIVFIVLFYFVRGVGGPIFNGYINALVSSDKRATVLSVRQMGVRLVFSCVGPFLGWIHDRLSLSAALFSAAIVFTVLGVVILFFMYTYRVLDIEEKKVAPE